MIIDFYKKVNVYFYVLIAQNKAFKIVYFCILFLLTFSLFPCIIESSRGTQKQEGNEMTFNEYWQKICDINNKLFFENLNAEKKKELEKEKRELIENQKDIVIQFM